MIQSAGKSTKQTRYRAYFWLMNASSVAVLFSAVEPAVDHLFGFTLDQIFPPPVIAVLLPFIAFFLLVVPMFLICARFMRDEYCEELWKRTFVVLAYIVALLPFVYLVFYWSTFFALGQPKELPPLLAWPAIEVTMGTAVYLAWTAYMILFVFTFQVLRWRDSR